MKTNLLLSTQNSSFYSPKQGLLKFLDLTHKSKSLKTKNHKSIKKEILSPNQQLSKNNPLLDRSRKKSNTKLKPQTKHSQIKKITIKLINKNKKPKKESLKKVFITHKKINNKNSQISLGNENNCINVHKHDSVIKDNVTKYQQQFD